jgi:hypothetical protein
MARKSSLDPLEEVCREKAEAARVHYLKDRTPENRAVWFAALKTLTNLIYLGKPPAV